jgi:YEATS domain-containing protein 4
VLVDFLILSADFVCGFVGQGLSIFRPIIYGNTAQILTLDERAKHVEDKERFQHTHRWTVAVRSAASKPGGSDIVGGADDLSYFIKRVTFKLHETYQIPTRRESPALLKNIPF